MNQQWRYRVIGATLLGLTAAGCAHHQEPRTIAPAAAADRAATVAIADAFEAALTSGDEAAAQALLAPDVLIYESGGQEASREEYASHHMKGDIAFLRASRREVLSRASGGDGAHGWVSTRSRITGHHRDKDVDILSTETMVLKRTSEGWRITHIHWSSRPAAKGP